ncbi:plastocyanin/azurin family copper-binding protein [Cupriavidus metallidurans]|uniref:Plastocyanin n=1 Tax=Cupriavidus metallidurans TaxID=119219 RepID=A0A482IYB7_9BURK|nr:cupredoxin family protein [Cupriavidus metallidurans]QBP12553.1 plastocyanin [Cupriavidus metallidurans]
MKRIAAFVAVFLVALPTAFAHDGTDHAKHGMTKKEQTAWGVAGDRSSVTRTVEVVMSDDMKFSPSNITVKNGETVRFLIKNSGQVLHELVLGTAPVLDEHAKMMMMNPNMAHSEPYMVHVKPGQSGELVWNFNRPGVFDFACLIAGHYQAGMKGKVVVSAQ